MVSESMGVTSCTCSQTVDQLYEMFPHLKEKLEAQLAKVPAERRDWFVRNQTAIFTKLHHQQQRLHSASSPATSAVVTVTWLLFTLNGILIP